MVQLERFGKSPSVDALYDKAYRRIDPVQLSESSTTEDSNPYQGYTNNPEVCQISADLQRVYNEHIEEGGDETIANTLALQQVMGKRKGLGFGSASSGKTKSRIVSNTREEDFEAMKDKVTTLQHTLDSVVSFLKQHGLSLPEGITPNSSRAPGTSNSSRAPGGSNTPNSSGAREEEEDEN